MSAVYASPLERAKETAAPIARATGCRVRTLRGLIDTHPGEWTGRRLSDLRRRKDWTEVQRRPSGFQFPGGESFVHMQARVVDAIEGLVKRHRGEVVVAVSHSDPICVALTHFMGAHIDQFQRLAVSPASVR